ncbi:dTDP-4-dehydrorhamnose reductase [Thermophagus sp. OGC60D27]|uniref:dTDP-4-dehydrorhamnose reductase n=1 Tax=Thermophagus sp. OGC60D27 TaxID=3458415 RepID=UPI0040380F29
MPKILIIGKEGQLGSTFHKLTWEFPQEQVTFTTIDQMDLSNPTSIKEFFVDKAFDFIINCAAYTAVDKAEEESDTAYQLNAEAPALIAREAARLRALFVHISTDYVFDGRHFRPLSPNDTPNPVSIYGKSKLKGEKEVLRIHPDSIIIRTSWLYSIYGQNFLKTMIRLGKEKQSLNVVFDQIGTPTFAEDLASSILSIIQNITTGQTKAMPGVYHYSNEGVCSWYDFAKAIFRITGIDCNVIPVTSDYYPTKAKRPYYSVLDKSLIKQTYGIAIPHWQESLVRCLKQLKMF